MSFVSVCGLVIAMLLFIVLIRRFSPEFAPPLSLCITILLTMSALASLLPLFDYLKELELRSFDAYLPYLLKSVGISVLSSTAADLCRDCGEQAIGAKLELLGKCQILVLSIPLLRELLELSGELMRLS